MFQILSQVKYTHFHKGLNILPFKKMYEIYENKSLCFKHKNIRVYKI